MTRIARLCITVALSLAAPLVMGAKPANVPAGSYEVDSDHVTLPPTDPGTLTIQRDCSGCAPLSFSTTITTIYELGEQSVRVSDMRSQFSLHPASFVLVVLDKDYKHVKLVRMSVPNAATR